MAPEDLAQQYPLYYTTFCLHRVSPFHIRTETQLDNTTLRQHAKRFRDILAGEVLRGVRVGLAQDEDVLARVGSLQTVTWKILPEEEAWSMDDETQLYDETTMNLAGSRGMIVTITYEKIAYRAILLKEDKFSQDISIIRGEETRLQHFPLLLSKMPSSLRDTFTEFLATTFDARVSQLHLSGQFLTRTFEQYLSDLSVDEEGEPMDIIGRSRSLRSTIKDIVIIVGFDRPSSSLKTIDINIAREDLPRMVARGKNVEDGSASGPFFNALVTYIKGNMALDLRHENVKILRIACGAFVLGGEGKIKITYPQSINDGNPHGRATRRLINNLVETAVGTLRIKEVSNT